jgi:hypothetical protein
MLFSSGGMTTIKNDGTNYIGVGTMPVTTEAMVQQVVPAGGHFTSFFCSVAPTVGNSSSTCRLRDTPFNSVTGAYGTTSNVTSCSFSSGATTCSVTTGLNVSFNAGDLIDVEIDFPNGTPGVTTVSAAAGFGP